MINEIKGFVKMKEIKMSDAAQYVYDRDYNSLAKQFIDKSKQEVKFRLDMNLEEFKILLELFKELTNGRRGKKEYEYLLNDLELLKDVKQIIISKRKKEATKKATETRSKKVKEKIENAINILNLENKKITPYTISKTSGVSFQTVKKYISKDTLKSLNENKS